MRKLLFNGICRSRCHEVDKNISRQVKRKKGYSIIASKTYIYRQDYEFTHVSFVFQFPQPAISVVDVGDQGTLQSGHLSFHV